MPIRIDTKNICKDYGSTKVLKNITLSIFPGEFIGLLGPSGAGKSTLLKTLNGFEKPSKGDVLYNSQNLHKNFDQFRAHIGYVPQDDIVHNTISVEKVLYYTSLLRLPETDKRERKRRIDGVLKTLELDHRKKLKVKKLSGGQRKRVNIGVELINSPPVLFLDEPTSGLDPGLEEKMMKLFRTLAKEGRTVILTTHIMESVDFLDFLAILIKGRLAYFAPPKRALSYFDVPEFPDIYKRLSEATPQKWAERFRNSSLYRKYVLERLARTTSFKIEKKSEAPKKPSSKTKQTPKTDIDKKEPTLDEELERLKNELNP